MLCLPTRRGEYAAARNVSKYLLLSPKNKRVVAVFLQMRRSSLPPVCASWLYTSGLVAIPILSAFSPLYAVAAIGFVFAKVTALRQEVYALLKSKWLAGNGNCSDILAASTPSKNRGVHSSLVGAQHRRRPEAR
jgi:hypothetical protein